MLHLVEYILELLGAHPILHISRIKVNRVGIFPFAFCYSLNTPTGLYAACHSLYINAAVIFSKLAILQPHDLENKMVIL
jgi:hypothetical protein